MTAPSQTSSLPSWLATPNVTSSPESVDGVLPSDLPVGLMIALYGRDRVLASLSATQAQEAGLLTSGTYGRIGSILYGSSSLPSSLVNRLKKQLNTDGLILYKMTWKEKLTPSHRLVYRLAGSAHRTSGNDCGSWPTARSQDAKHAAATEYELNRDPNKDLLHVKAARVLSGWPTTTRDWKDTGCLSEQQRNSPSMVALSQAGWASPKASNGTGAGTRGQGGDNLQTQVIGLTAIGSPAPMVSGGQLNPAHSRWLMGYGTGWDFCGGMVTLSSRKSRQK